MTAQRRWLIAFYAMISLIALAATWGQNLQYFWQTGEFSALNQFLPDLRVNPASRSISVDIALFLLAAAAFMVSEARRLGVRFVWLYILFGFLIAISVTFPLFMIARELRLQRGAAGEAGFFASDIVGLVVTTVLVAGLSWYVLR